MIFNFASNLMLINAMSTVLLPPVDFFVECDKDGVWWIVGTENDTISAYPEGPFASRMHAINAGVERFWRN